MELFLYVTNIVERKVMADIRIPLDGLELEM